MIADNPNAQATTEDPCAYLGVYHAELRKCELQMRIWRQRFEEFLERKPDAASALPVAMLRLSHTLGTAIIAAGEMGPEERWDSLQESFLDVVDLAEVIVAGLSLAEGQSSFSVEMGCELLSSHCSN